MPATTKCFSLVRGQVLRVTRLDGCGAVLPGPDSVVVSDGFITVGLTANNDTGTAISITNAAGKICIADTPAPKFTGYTVAVEFCGVDPDLFSLMTGQAKVLDGAGNSVGFKVNSDIDADDSGFALEMWSNVPAAVCEPGQTVSFGYFVLPFLKGGVIGDFTVGNDAVNFSLAGAQSKDGNAWGAGPFNVVLGSGGLPSPLLSPLDPNDHLLVELTGVSPPAAGCGAIALGVPALTAVSGAPGHYTPANAYGPANLAGATGLIASPTTAWVTGSYVPLRDGTTMHWTGTAWAANPA
jgi:hypothetical protein